MENKNIKIIITVFIVLLLIILSGIVIFKKFASQSSLEKSSLGLGQDNRTVIPETLVAEPSSIETNPLIPNNLKIYLKSGEEKRDITSLVAWEVSDPKGISVANQEPILGQLVAYQLGDYSVKVIYQDKSIIIPVKVLKAELKISCKVIPKQAKVGEKVAWIMIFDKMGTPQYKYFITGSDGLNSQESIATITYNTPGEKIVKMKAVDYIGNEAETTCEPYIVLPK